MKKRQNVTIKGTKEGLVLHLDDKCSYDDLKKELDQKLSANLRTQDDRHLISVKVEIGNRYITEEQREELKHLIRQKKNLVVDDIISNVITKVEAERLKAEAGIMTVSRIIRSGQVLETSGDLLLIGDVNPGGTVVAGGNIFIMGTLKGVAHAGCFGNEQAVIAASSMKPSQLRISDCINRSPDSVKTSENREMECAYIDDNRQIIVDRLQALIHLRPDLTRLEGGH
ncbi:MULTISPECIES: septum site-determining protein MinC [Neobacillus]|jgi:septum site-determining protein MinC|uniref:septum site-determining protein MinC n=1 Tax=Neobacillus TaxID=2675232 RepID=UPI0027DFF17E|nr:septum site-determining protein MinC [Neobacillus sp. PS2-9]WML59582.1 septum site-determining protein MinC [Neobacillus sp. PS2-9]